MSHVTNENEVFDVYNERSNKNDTSILDDEENYNGMDKDDSEEFNFASTMELRKNLVDAFDKHILEPPTKRQRSIELVGSVKAKVVAFEKESSRNLEPRQQMNSSFSRFKKLPTSRPPTAPSSQPLTSPFDSCLNVFLRIRPPSSVSSSTNDTSVENTIEIISKNDEDPDIVATKIRTYPPENSNAAKSVRGQHHLHNLSHNTDLMFSKNYNSERGDYVKGVKEYEFSKVFGTNTSQEDIYQGVAAPLVEGLFPRDNDTLIGERAVGNSALLFAYGITNAGKTHTIMGGSRKRKMSSEGENEVGYSDGVIPRSLHHILAKIEEMGQVKESDGAQETEYALYLSYFEIYNEQIFDLLPGRVSKPGSASTRLNSKTRVSNLKRQVSLDQPLRIRENREGRTFIRNLRKNRVRNMNHGLKLIREAMLKRKTSSNNINSDSSRSHCICQFEVMAQPPSKNEHDNESVTSDPVTSGYNTEEEDLLSQKQETKSTTLWVVDLAGSERSKRTGAMTRSSRQKEAALINSSLMKLMRCLQTMKNNQNQSSSSAIVPFRESKLTHILMNHLTGSSASCTSMIVNVNPSVSDYDETQHVLAYATDVKSVKISEEEYIRKRKAIQFHDHTHGEDGRLLERNNSTKTKSRSPPHKVTQLARKLSPRALLKKRREKLTSKKKSELQQLRSASNSTDNEVKNLKSSKSTISKRLNKKNNAKIDLNKLNIELVAIKKENEKLKLESTMLKAQLETKESEIRVELADEVEEQFNYMRQKHVTEVRRLMQQINDAPTPSKSTRKIQRDKAEQIIQELIDKNDECEEEMARMRQSHEEEILSLKRKHNQFVANKDEEINILKLENGNLTTKLNNAISEKEEILFELNEMKDTYGGFGTDESSDDEDLRDSTSTYDVKGEHRRVDIKDSTFADGTGSSSGQVRRLPRGRCSEVACANVCSPNKIKASSTAKKKGRKFKRSPFALIQNSDSEKMRELLISPGDKENLIMNTY